MVVNMTGVVKVNSVLHVRNRPSQNGAIIGLLKNGATLNITQMEGEWCYASNTGGWSHSQYISLSNNDNRVTVSNKQEQNDQILRDAAIRKQVEMLNQNSELSTSLYDDTTIADSLLVNNLNGIYGIPYQFMESVDPRLSVSDGKEALIGRKYSEKIVSKMPLLYITPGTAKFMSNYSKEEKDAVANFLQSKDSDEISVADFISNKGRYFTFEFAYDSYFSYVDALCQAGAKFLEIGNLRLNIGGTEAEAQSFEWQNALNNSLKSSLSSQNFIGFYVDSSDSVNESFSNGTTQSQIAETINGFSATAKELGFLLGAGAGVEYSAMEESKLNEVFEGIDALTNKYVNGGFLKNLGSNFSTISVGGKLLFPEIWSDSEFSRDVDFTIKLRTPDSDTVSWYLNIYVPLCHLIALAAGHQTDNPNGYYSPFLVRAYYKGLFNVDMGIVTSMSIRKGKEAAWNIDGLPTEIDIDINIKDLYNMLSIVSDTEPKNFVSNNLLMDYVANTCGVNINQIDLLRSLEIYALLWKNRVTDIPMRTVRKIQDAIANYGMELYNAVLEKFLI